MASYPTASHMYAAHFGTARACRAQYMVTARHVSASQREFFVARAKAAHRDAMQCLRRMREYAQRGW